MDFCIVENDIVINVTRCDKEFAAEQGYKPMYDGVRIGDIYAPPDPLDKFASKRAVEKNEADIAYIAMMSGIEI